MLKNPGSLFSFGRLNKKRSAAGGGDGGGGASHSSGLRWRLKTKGKKRPFKFVVWFVDSVVFKIVSFLEAVVLVSRLAFFFLFCGCHI
nr:AF211538_1 Avr9/Cf-9 rapidly elicited protein 180 [Ipomoea batatas]